MADQERYQEALDLVEVLHGALLGLMVERSDTAWELAVEVLSMSSDFLGLPTPKEI